MLPPSSRFVKHWFSALWMIFGGYSYLLCWALFACIFWSESYILFAWACASCGIHNFPRRLFVFCSPHFPSFAFPNRSPWPYVFGVESYSDVRVPNAVFCILNDSTDGIQWGVFQCFNVSCWYFYREVLVVKKQRNPHRWETCNCFKAANPPRGGGDQLGFSRPNWLVLNPGRGEGGFPG